MMSLSICSSNLGLTLKIYVYPKLDEQNMSNIIYPEKLCSWWMNNAFGPKMSSEFDAGGKSPEYKHAS